MCPWKKDYSEYQRGQETTGTGSIIWLLYPHNDVERIVYATEEDREIVDLPILNFGISATKRMILEELEKGETSVKNLSVKVGINRGMTYNHIRELREIGFITADKLEITTADELAII